MSLEGIYSDLQQLNRRESYLETLESGPVIGFDRTISRAMIIGPDGCIITDKYTTVEAGGSLTLKAGAELMILAG